MTTTITPAIVQLTTMSTNIVCKPMMVVALTWQQQNNPWKHLEPWSGVETTRWIMNHQNGSHHWPLTHMYNGVANKSLTNSVVPKHNSVFILQKPKKDQQLLWKLCRVKTQLMHLHCYQLEKKDLIWWSDTVDVHPWSFVACPIFCSASRNPKRLALSKYNHCWAKVSRRLMRDQCHALQRCLFASEVELKPFHQLLVNVVLATDMFNKEINDVHKECCNRAFPWGIVGQLPKSMIYGWCLSLSTFCRPPMLRNNHCQWG